MTTTHNLVQGSDAWNQFRLQHFGASEAAAMLGLSKKVKRNELLHMKHTGNAKEFSDWVQANILDYGHEVEALARPIIEELIGEELYPVTCSDGLLSASCDGLTMTEETAFEHKQWNEALAASVAAGELPDEYQPQCQQIMMVTGAERVIFAVSDGTREKMVHMDVMPDLSWHTRILAGWAQFEKDLADYVPAEAVPAAVAAPIKDLPAIIYKLDGLALTSNLTEYKAAALKLVEDSKTELTTDQDFADRDALCKKFKKAEESIEILRGQVIGEIKDVDAFCRDLEEISGLIRQARLNGEKKVAAEKENRRNEIIAGVKAKWVEHIAGLNKRLGKPYMPDVATNFAGVMKGLKSLSSMNDAVDTELARAKIEANAIADKIQVNLNSILALKEDELFKHEKAELPALFADIQQLVLKSPEDCAAVVANRVAGERDRQAAERERIAEEERAKAEASTKVQMEATVERTQTLMESHQQARRVTVELNDRPTRQTADTGARVRLGEINARIAPLSISAEGLAQLGFPHVETDKSAKLYRLSDFPAICAAIASHVTSIANELAQAA